MAQSITQNIWGKPSRVQLASQVSAAKKAGTYPTSTGKGQLRPVPKDRQGEIRMKIAEYKAIKAMYEWESKLSS